MKKFIIFIVGFVVGVLATIFLALLINVASEVGFTELTETGECIITDGEIEVFQVIEPSAALAKKKYGRSYSDEIVVLLIDYDGKTFYDKQKIEIPANKCARRVGTYRYKSGYNSVNTVPAVTIE